MAWNYAHHKTSRVLVLVVLPLRSAVFWHHATLTMMLLTANADD